MYAKTKRPRKIYRQFKALFEHCTVIQPRQSTVERLRYCYPSNLAFKIILVLSLVLVWIIWIGNTSSLNNKIIIINTVILDVE